VVEREEKRKNEDGGLGCHANLIPHKKREKHFLHIRRRKKGSLGTTVQHPSLGEGKGEEEAERDRRPRHRKNKTPSLSRPVATQKICAMKKKKKSRGGGEKIPTLSSAHLPRLQRKRTETSFFICETAYGGKKRSSRCPHQAIDDMRI